MDNLRGDICPLTGLAIEIVEYVGRGFDGAAFSRQMKLIAPITDVDAETTGNVVNVFIQPATERGQSAGVLRFQAELA